VRSGGEESAGGGGLVVIAEPTCYLCCQPEACMMSEMWGALL